MAIEMERSDMKHSLVMVLPEYQTGHEKVKKKSNMTFKFLSLVTGRIVTEI